eukprot:918217-Prorocentrum_minimum.AAC.2
MEAADSRRGRPIFPQAGVAPECAGVPRRGVPRVPRCGVRARHPDLGERNQRRHQAGPGDC